MSKKHPIPKPPRAPTPVEKAIKALMDEVGQKGSAVIDGVIVHPTDLAALEALITGDPLPKALSRPDLRSAVFAPKPAQPLPTGGPLTEAWRKQVEEMKRNPPSLMPLGRGAQITGMSFDEVHSTLEKQLEDSLWAMASQRTPIFTREGLYQHVGAGHMEDDWYVKRLNGLEEVFLLCKCRMILVLQRCWYERATGPEPEDRERCDEPAFVGEGTLRKDARCGQHLGSQRGSAQ